MDDLGNRTNLRSGTNQSYTVDAANNQYSAVDSSPLSYIDEALIMTDLTVSGGSDYYYAHNHLYSPVALLEADGDVVERYEYNAYGKPTIYNAQMTQTYAASQYDNPVLFTGRSYDAESGLYYYCNRAYLPCLGRFSQKDPLGLWPSSELFNPLWQNLEGINTYQYVDSLPIMHLDPSGLRAVTYGNYCGRGNCGENFTLPPIDFMDACCQQHDLDWREAENRSDRCRDIVRHGLGFWEFRLRGRFYRLCERKERIARCKANKRLLECVSGIGADPTVWPNPAPDTKQAELYYPRIKNYFGPRTPENCNE